MTYEKTRLDLVTEGLNECLRDAEDELIKLGLGVSAEVRMTSDEMLGFGKINGEWKLYARHVGESRQEVVPLLSKSRLIRITAAHILSDLHQALLDEHASSEENVEKAQAVAYDFVKRLRGW